MGCQKDGREAEEGGQAAGFSAAALAVPVEDVDLGRLEMEAGLDPHHWTGPGRKERCRLRWGHRRLQGCGLGDRDLEGCGSCKNTLWG